MTLTPFLAPKEMPIDIAISVDNTEETYPEPVEEVIYQDTGEKPLHLREPL